MAAKGSIAKEEVKRKIIQCFGQDKVFESDKKLYINTTENGEPVQIAITMTCPKNLVSPTGGFAAPALNFEDDDDSSSIGKPVSQNMEITPEEKKNIADLMERLGL
jgi:hypothetical protein